MGTLNKTKIIEHAEKLIAKEKFKDAIKEYQKIQEPSDIRIRLKIAELYYKLNEVENAERIFTEIAEYYITQGFFLKAVAVLKQILKIKPDSEQILLKLASLYQQLGLIPDAINIYLELVEIYNKLERKIDKLNAIKKLLDLDPDNIRSRLRLAEEMSRESMIKESVEQFRVTCNTLKKMGAIEDYIMVAERLLYHEPSDLETSRELVSYFIESDDGLKSLTYLQTSYKATPQDPEILELIARSFEIVGQPFKASIVWKELAHYFDRAGLNDEKMEAYERVLLLNPDDGEARKILGIAATEESVEFEFDEAEEVAQSDVEEVSEEISVDGGMEEEISEEKKLIKEEVESGAFFDDLPTELRDEIEELEFYINQKLHDEACSKLDEMIKKYPQYPFLLEYLDRIE